MVPLAKLSNQDMLISLDKDCIYHCLLDENFALKVPYAPDKKAKLYPGTNNQNLNQSDLTSGYEQLLLKDIIEALCKTKKPMIVKDDAGKMIGAITMDIYPMHIGPGVEAVKKLFAYR